ncbi:MAG: ArnT family glycosyltransferase [Blastocatellia bacterium]
MSTRRPIGIFRSFFSGRDVQSLTLSGLFEDRRIHALLLASMALLVLLGKLHLGDLGGYDDAVYAHEGKQMLATGQWWSVYLNGQLDFDKPPMFVWLEAFSMWGFGVSDFAARLPAALLGFGTILVAYFLTRELTDSYWMPVWVMLILLTTHAFTRFAMRAMTDVPFTFFFASSILFYLKGLNRRHYFLWCGLALGFAILTRSFLGLIAPGIIIAHLAVTGRASVLRSGYFLAGMGMAVGAPLIWFLSQYQLHGAPFLAAHFSFTRDNLPLTSGRQPAQFAAGLLQYPRLLLEGYWPWLPLMAVGFWTAGKRAIRERDSAACLLVIWVLAVVVPFSFARFKWLRYIMPAFPAFSILAAITLNAWIRTRHREAFLKIVYVALWVTMAGMWINPKYRDRPEEMRFLAPIAETATAPENRILLYTERAPRDAHLFQIIWYANRNCELLGDFNEVVARLADSPGAAAITDKAVFHAALSGNDGGAVDPRIRILGETERFVCWTMPRQTAEYER